MLPTKGYFKDINCPYHERSCGRPYCHFRHRKKVQETEDTSQSSNAAIPTYKPTPKSELASNKSHIPISYVPDVVRSSSRSNFNIKDRPTYKPTPKSVLSKSNTISTAPAKVAAVSAYTPTPITQLQDATKQPAEIDFDELSQEFKMIDEILTDSMNDENVGQENTSITKVEEDVKSNSDKVDRPKDKGERDKSKDKHSKSRDSKSKDEKDRERREKEKDRKKDDKTKTNKSDKDRDKEKKDKNKSTSSTTKDTSSKSKSSSSSRSKDKDREERHRKDKHSRSSGSSSSSKRHDKEKEKHSKSSSRNKDDKMKINNEKHKEEQEELPVELPPFQDGDYDVDIDIDFDDDPDIDSMMIEDECFKIFNEYKAPEEINVIPYEPQPITQMTVAPPGYIPGKKRVAYTNAAAAKEEAKPRPTVKQLQPVGSILQNRIRIARQAHANNEGQNIMQEMKNIKRAASMQASMSEVKRMKSNGQSRPPPPTPAPTQASTSLIDDIISGRPTANTTTKPPIRRIAPVANVTSIQQAKARIDEIKNRNAAVAAKTSAQTHAKGARRAAHVPDVSLSNIPDVLAAERSKLPVNVRTRYLGLLADECVKLYVATDEAYARALNEEFKCYERCSALITYRNSAMLAVNRLRKEVQVRETSGLGPLQVGESPHKEADSILHGKRFYDLIKGFMLSEEELNMHGFPRKDSNPGRARINNEHKQITSENLEKNQRVCCRCHKLYLINRDGFPLFEEECCYHPLRKRTIRGERTYLCCKSSEDTGCAISNTHVSEVSADRVLEGFQSTFESDYEDDPRNHAVYALDCEMCYTTKGLELTRVTVVDSKLKTIYESLVKPFNPIIDYNTRFSGITQEHMDKTTTSILHIQATILNLCSAKTILIGHSLESDLKALKIIHNSVVDTSVMFPHKFGLPHKRALRALASDHLKKIIQNDVGGHDSAEDALAAMELVIWKVKEDLKVKGIKH